MDYIEYINGIKDKIAALPEEYCFSSAINYAGLDDDLEVVLLDFFENDCGNGLKIRYPKREYLLQIRAFGIIQIINNEFETISIPETKENTFFQKLIFIL